jgi:ferredoxin
VLFTYQQKKSATEVQDVPTTFSPQVILGVRPCDAAGVEILDKVMNWDYRDELWFGRREATTIVSFACPGMDSSCFCTAVGCEPHSRKAADALLTPVDGGYLFEALTPKGEALLALSDGKKQPPPDAATLAAAEALRKTAREKVEKNVEHVPSDMPEWLARNFNHELWKTLALRCHGCGACAAVCPTCHCFDIVDEHDRYDSGARRRNWDSCQTGKFTLHASGHNPRQTQSERMRQRVMHKFSIYPSRFDAILCTGCGRCARVCAAGMNLPEIVSQLIELAGAEPQGSGQ